MRGKEIKKVEFGAKVNKIQIDGINFIQHLSFKAFNEGTQFQDSISQAQRLTGIKIKQAGADAIYATNANRKFATSHSIKTDFVRKGRAGKDENQRKKIAKQLRRARASFLEGSFGNEKEHFHLKRINARTEKNEDLMDLLRHPHSQRLENRTSDASRTHIPAESRLNPPISSM